MIQILFKQKTYERTYLRSIERLEFDNVLDLVWTLFEHNPIPIKDLEEWTYQMLEALGYESFNDIPEDELRKVGAQYFQLRSEKIKSFDSEKESYLLLANIHKGNLITFIDDEVLTDVESPIQLQKDSVISFIDREKINAISFTTI